MLPLFFFFFFFNPSQERDTTVVIDSHHNGSKREAEDRVIPWNIDVDNSDVEVKRGDERSVFNLSEVR